ncbi:hypothetical protein [Mesorhizobium sp.]|uniref:hypothetical protein n=1 Tax=Mesorhizobium sp. TaxID=1871066 RepID=UPI000FE84BAA|nr:hypothetical protein [Mesorhizobium sp.]RWF86813.1 MAG: hypothetical protein EOQ36_15520 [Mesorhizobium sp.]RWF90802.1 MAG: hypothetical protein EOQ45_28640 [Mesorhizobium sp.]RWJ56958.1 MAG: hypothetical protein EOR32_32650 [Mesorhizobium sp.]RWJ63154.1 MAG: hypothetical protein EOR34_33000 [Mesorhizobium sp.]RWJ92576.1 MAG: hypothetical protein EOR38_32650 [Mesorhizobium sp.]
MVIIAAMFDARKSLFQFFFRLIVAARQPGAVLAGVAYDAGRPGPFLLIASRRRDQAARRGG